MLAAENVARYTIGAPDVVHVKVAPDGRHMMLLGAKRGYAGLLLVYADATLRNYDVFVGAESRDTGASRTELVVGGLRVLPSAGVMSFATGNDVVQIKSFGHVDSYDVRVAPSIQ